MSWFSNLFTKREALTPYGQQWASDRLDVPSTIEHVSSYALPAVYRCMDLITSAISTLPVDTFRKVGANTKQIDSPSWIRQPNVYITAADFWAQIVNSLLSKGNAYVHIARNAAGAIVNLTVLAPHRIKVQRNKDTGQAEFLIDKKTVLTSDEILHVKGPSRPGDLEGMSPLEAARNTIGLGLSAADYARKFYDKGVTLSGVIEHPAKATQEEAEGLREQFGRAHSGHKNSHSIGVLSGGAQFKPISITPEQAQFLESRKFTATEVAGFFGVPAYMVDPSVTSTWGTGITEQNQAFVQNTLQPWLIRIEQAFSTFLIPGGGYIRFNVNARLRTKTTERFAAYATAFNTGFMNRDEIRALEDLDPVVGGEEFYISVNTKPLGSDGPDVVSLANAIAALMNAGIPQIEAEALVGRLGSNNGQANS